MQRVTAVTLIATFYEVLYQLCMLCMRGILTVLTKAADVEYVGKCKARRSVADDVVTDGVAKGTVQYRFCK